jgi:glycine cleavage system H protein
MDEKPDAYPGDRLYSKESLWVKKEDSILLIGVNLPALEYQTGIYHIKLPPPGTTLEKGDPFGFYEDEEEAKDLFAPISGQILDVNQEVLQDPALIEDDPYDRGWLMRVDPSRPEEMDLLMAAEEALEWARFAPHLGGEALTVSRAYKRGRPWWSDLDARLDGRLIVKGRQVRIGLNETFTPLWEPGDKWKIEVRYAQPSVARMPDPPDEEKVKKWQFEFLGYEFVEGEEVLQVKAIEVEGTPPMFYYLVNIRPADFTLLNLYTVQVINPTKKTEIYNSYKNDTWISFKPIWNIILDHPRFPEDNFAEVREIAPPEEEPLRQKTTFSPDERVMEIEITTNLDGDTLRSIQIWEKGLPWWREARRLREDTELIAGKLLLSENTA